MEYQIMEAPTTTEVALTPGEKRHLKSLETRIERGLQTFREVGLALMEIRDSRLYRETHASFETYTIERWNLERNRAYQLIGAVEVIKAIGGTDEAGPQTESQARELVALVREDPKLVQQVWKEVQATGQPITAQVIRSVVRQHTNGDAGDPPTMAEALAQSINRVIGQYERWLATKPSRRDRAIVTAALDKLDHVVG